MMNGVLCRGEKIYKLRRARHFSQNEVASMVGVQRETVSGWEKKGDHIIQAEKFRKLAEVLKVSPEVLYADDQYEILVLNHKTMERLRAAASASKMSMEAWISLVTVIGSTEIRLDESQEQEEGEPAETAQESSMKERH